ncbi:MAG: DNA polymerase III subunit delta [Desulfuromonas sp.]|nr:MAG: DNA polymerase III subunit delta [Desulfuromonas sp.]
MTPADLQKAIQQSNISPLLLIFGADGFLVERAVRQVKEAILTPGTEDFNFYQASGKELNVDDLLSVAQTLPVFAERRLVLIKDIQAVPAALLDQLQLYLKDPNPQTCLLLSGEKIDSRRKFFQEFKKKGDVVEFKPLSEKQLPSFVRERLAAEQFEMTGDALMLFCSRVSTNLQEVQAELIKLQTFMGEKRLIDVAEVQALTSGSRSENIFEVSNAVAMGDTAAALTLVKKLLEEGEAPLKMLSLLVRHFRQLWQLRELEVQRVSQQEMARRVRVPPFVVGRMLSQARRYSRVDFRRAFELFLETDLAIKSSGAEPEARLEGLLLSLTRRNA